MRWAVATIVAAACGRIDFAHQRADGGGSVDVAVPANLVFVTSTSMIGSFGGTGAADGMCAARATARGLPGTYVAWLATTGRPASSRLGSARGWRRIDGAPVADTAAGLFTGIMFNTLDVDESGALVTDNYAFTGTRISIAGESVDLTCNDWTSGGSGDLATMGYLRSATPDGLDGALFPCSTNAHFYCFGIDYATPVQPIASGAGRIAFISTPVALGAGGINAFDTRCQNEATAAKLPGMYRAAVATTMATIISRFTVDARPWQRVDGTTISDGAGLFAATGRMQSFVNQRADGTYIAGNTEVYIWTGAPNPTVVGTAATTCSNWTSTSGNGTNGGVTVAEQATLWAIPVAQACALTTNNVLCLEQ